MNITEKIRLARLRLLNLHYKAGVGHVGGNLSCIDALMVLFHEVMKPYDQFVLSKGHSAGALYVTLHSLGLITDGELDTFHKDDTRLPGHPAPRSFDSIPFATGSLGHGLSLAVGLAQGKRTLGYGGRVYCLLSDGEMAEGSTQEGLNYARQHNLDITALIDANGWQGFSRTQFDLASLSNVVRCDGHNLYALKQTWKTRQGFKLIIAKTCKGHGVSGLEDTLASHYLPLTEAQYLEAVEALNAC